MITTPRFSLFCWAMGCADMCWHLLYQLLDGLVGCRLDRHVNPLVIQDINKLGLRQTLLWWVLLFPALLKRAGRTGTILDGMLVGLCFSLVSAFYWFYGLFAGMFGLVWLIWFLWTTRPPFRNR